MIVGEIVEECREYIDENKMIYNETLNVYKKVSNCAIYIVLFVVFLIASTVVTTVFIFFYWYLKNYKFLLLI